MRIACDTAGVGVYSSSAAIMHGDVVGGEHLERAAKRRLGQRVGVDADEQRSVDALAATVAADRLGDGEDVPFVEAAGRTTSRGALTCRTRRAAPARPGRAARRSTP